MYTFSISETNINELNHLNLLNFYEELNKLANEGNTIGFFDKCTVTDTEFWVSDNCEKYGEIIRVKKSDYPEYAKKIDEIVEVLKKSKLDGLPTFQAYENNMTEDELDGPITYEEIKGNLKLIKQMNIAELVIFHDYAVQVKEGKIPNTTFDSNKTKYAWNEMINKLSKEIKKLSHKCFI